MTYGYARVSTAKQNSGNSFEDQEQALKQAGAEIIVKDTYTGTKMDRPAFTKLMQDLKAGDKLIVTKLDRFARSAVQGVEVVRDLMAKGVTVHILNMGLADSTPTGKLMVTMLLAFAEFERDMIVERTQAGRKIARDKAIAEGRPANDHRPKKFNPDKLNHALDLLEDGNSYTEVEKLMNISKSTLIRAMRERRAEQMERA